MPSSKRRIAKGRIAVMTKQINLILVRAGEIRMEEGEDQSKRPGGRT